MIFRIQIVKILVFLVVFILVAAAVPYEKPDRENLKEFLFVSISSTAPDIYHPVFPANTDSVIIPLKKAGRLFLIEAKVEDQTGNLVFDTGASNLVLNSTYFRDHVRSGTTVTSGITGSLGKIERITVEKMEFGELTYQQMRADVANLGHIENKRGVKILGLVGFGMMKSVEIILDASRSELRLYKVDKEGKRINSKSAGIKSDYIQEIEGNGNILFLKAMIAGKNLNFCFDTGAETNAIGSDANKTILSTLTITRRIELKGAGNAKSEVLFGRMNDFTMGAKKINDMETIVTNLRSLNEAYNTTIDGMLGYNFLEQGVITINFVKRQFGIQFTKGAEK
jgi:predicted aspartyl protease